MELIAKKALTVVAVFCSVGLLLASGSVSEKENSEIEVFPGDTIWSFFSEGNETYGFHSGAALVPVWKDGGGVVGFRVVRLPKLVIEQSRIELDDVLVVIGSNRLNSADVLSTIIRSVKRKRPRKLGVKILRSGKEKELTYIINWPASPEQDGGESSVELDGYEKGTELRDPVVSEIPNVPNPSPKGRKDP